MKRLIIANRNEEYYVVHYGWDEGNMEDGPIIKSDNIVVKARNAKAAENKVFNKMPGIEGCWAELATAQDLENFQADMKEFQDEYDELVKLGLVDLEEAAQASQYLAPDFHSMSIGELKQYYNDVSIDNYKSFSEWIDYLRKTGQR